MEDTVLSRLRASKAGGVEAEASGEKYVHFDLGFGSGRQWAKKSATHAELERLAAARDADGDDFLAGPAGEPVAATDFIAAITGRPSVEVVPGEVRSFWEPQSSMYGLRDLWMEDAFAKAFALGAISVWGEVKDLV